MATYESGGTLLESWLNKATDPANQVDRWDCIQAFYELINQETDGPQVATLLLAHKIQSPQEREALQALTVLEACMNNCGKRFHHEAIKFRFLNELIKVLSPKYLGQWSPQKVKDKVIEVLYSWTLWLKDEPKLQEAYRMLKKQGVVKKDPKLSDTIVMPPPPQRSAQSVFDQEEKAKQLARLLKSSRPEDLEAANRLIKSTMKEEQDKAEKESKRVSTLEEVETSTRQLRELLKKHRHTGNSSQLKALYERCDRMRPSLFRLASDTTDDDVALAQILAANDELTLVVNAYKCQVERRDYSSREGKGRANGKQTEECKTNAPTHPREIKSYHLIDLSALDSPRPHRKSISPSDFTACDSSLTFTSSSSVTPGIYSHLEGTFSSPTDRGLIDLGFDNLVSKAKQTPVFPKTHYDELMELSGCIHMNNVHENEGSDHFLRARGCGGNTVSTNSPKDGWSLAQDLSFTWSGSPSKTEQQEMEMSLSPVKVEESLCLQQPLTGICVPLETITPSQLEPITIHDQGGVHVSIHFAKEPPPEHPGVAVMVISTVNTSALLVTDVLFQAAVPKMMSVKLQPSSATHLPPYNPLLPPAAISQVLLLANPQRCKVRLRYKLTLTHGDQQLSETGELHNFPDWVSLVGF